MNTSEAVKIYPSEDEPLDIEQKKKLAICETVNKLIVMGEGGTEFEKTALPAARLQAFNFISQNPNYTKKDLDELLKKANELILSEQKYGSLDVPLPTIGIEIEFDQTTLTSDKRQVLDALEIPNYEDVNSKEPNTTPRSIWEINPDFSYSPKVQSRILHELIDMDIVPTSLNEYGDRYIDSKLPLSLHVNFGLPEVIDDPREVTKHFSLMSKLNSFMALAFSSPERIENKEYGYVFSPKDEKTKSSLKSGREKKSIGELVNSKILRLESRALEFRDKSTYRLMAESQCIIGAAIAFLKNDYGHNTTNKENRMNEIFGELMIKVNALLLEYDLNADSLYDDTKEVAQAMRETDVSKDAREIMTEFARKIHKIAFEK